MKEMTPSGSPSPKAPLAAWVTKPTQSHLLKLQSSWKTGSPIVSGPGRGAAQGRQFRCSGQLPEAPVSGCVSTAPDCSPRPPYLGGESGSVHLLHESWLGGPRAGLKCEENIFPLCPAQNGLEGPEGRRRRGSRSVCEMPQNPIWSGKL